MEAHYRLCTEDKERVKMWKEMYPKGMKAVRVNDFEEEPLFSFLPNWTLFNLGPLVGYLSVHNNLFLFLLFGVFSLLLVPKSKKDIKSKKE